jgi:hypothetical protein
VRSAVGPVPPAVDAFTRFVTSAAARRLLAAG